jgi:hypothetical protein
MDVTKHLHWWLGNPDQTRLGLKHLGHFVEELEHLFLLDVEWAHQGNGDLSFLWLQQILNEQCIERLVVVLLNEWCLHIGPKLAWLLLQFVN